MKVITPGHRYELANFEKKDEQGQIIQFIEKIPAPVEEAEFEGQLLTLNDGTTNEEVCEALIDRLKTMHAKVPSKETACAITHFEEGLLWLEKRTRDRISRQVIGTMQK